jgi:acyl-coenzyme A synthetase/AMP-(fatty) acid ligase
LDEVAFILCTSGSTGEPKPIAYSQRGILQQTRLLVDTVHLSARDRVLMLNPATTAAGVLTLFVPLIGCAVDIFSLAEFGLRDLRERLRRHPATMLRAVPSLLRTVAQVPDAREMLAGIRAVRASGETLLRADVELLRDSLPPNCVIHNRYGATELMGTWWVARPEDDHHPVRIAAGVPDPDVEAKIVDEAGRPCPAGEPGELWLRGRYGALGEWGPDGLSPGRLVPDDEDASLRVYRTGDLARLTPDGVIVVLGRRDRMVKVNGQRVELAEVETELRRSPEVRQAAVVAREAAGRVTLRAFVVAAADVAPGLEQRLRQALRAALPSYMQPARIERLDALPLLPGGKLDERALQARD